MIKIKIRCYVHNILIKLSKEINTNEFELEIKEGSTVYEFIDKLNLPQSKVRLVFVNGKQCKKSTMLKHGDYVKMIPFIPGG